MSGTSPGQERVPTQSQALDRMPWGASVLTRCLHLVSLSAKSHTAFSRPPPSAGDAGKAGDVCSDMPPLLRVFPFT